MFDKHADETIEAEIWVKAEAQGLAKGLEQGHIEIALDMLADNEPVEKIVKYSHLPESKVLELKMSLANEMRK